MLSISREDIATRLRNDNPWWDRRPDVPQSLLTLPRRDYFAPLAALAMGRIKRAIVVLGARRVGKTTLLRQLIGDETVRRHFPAILFASIDTPTYAGLGLGRFLEMFAEEFPHDPDGPRLVVFDEIQYLADWERHLKDLVDKFPRTRFVASGSAGAALKRRSDESGAGRFTDFELPPLTFAEFVRFRGVEDRLIDVDRSKRDLHRYAARDIVGLNRQFVDYVNFGGYPEAVFSPEVQAQFSQFVGRDIVDKVLLRDLPSLYGILDIQELNRLFAVLTYNTGQEISLEQLAQNAGVAKNTIQRYLDYLEAAFLIHRVRRVDENARRFQRQRNFKVYLTNPSMRAALFGPVDDSHGAFGALAESATLAQWIHSPDRRNLHYARWAAGEVDIVRLDPASARPTWAYDVKWSDHHVTRLEEVGSLVAFARKCRISTVGASTKTVEKSLKKDGIHLKLFPLSLHCYRLGKTTASEPALLQRIVLVELNQ